VAHCGQCDRACGANQVCTSGSCTDLPQDCPAGGCPFGSYCDLGQNRCAAGCLDDSGCNPGQACRDRACRPCAFDADGDGHHALGGCLAPADDCNDADPAVHGGATESCDGKDNDCDAAIDDGVQTAYYLDDDGDGYGSSAAVRACAAPSARHVTRAGDCDDGDAAIHPGAGEDCNGRDDDCNGSADDALTPPACALTRGVCAGTRQRCGGAMGWTPCAPADYGQMYEASEASCDRLDNDCDGTADGLSRACASERQGECAVGQETCATGTWLGCPAPAAETCNGKDDDCNGRTDDALTPPVCPLNQGVCRNVHLGRACNGAAGWQACDATLYGGAYEATETRCDSQDNDCDGAVDEAITRACSIAHLGPCAAGSETCGQGAWTGCPAPAAEQCGNAIDDDCDGTADEPGSSTGPSAIVADGDLPRLAVLGGGYVAAYRTPQGAIALQLLTAAGVPTGPAVIQPVTRPALLLDLAVYQGGVALAWVEQRPTSPSGPTTTYVRVYDAALANPTTAQVLPTSGSNWDSSEELRVAAVSGGAAFVVAERIFTDRPGYGQRFRFGLFPAAAPASTEIYFQGTGSQSQGAFSYISIAGLPAGFAVAWTPPYNDRAPAQLAVYGATGARVWGPIATGTYNIGRCQAVTYDGTQLLSLHHWFSWRNDPFALADGARGANQMGASALQWPHASDAAFVSPYHLALLEATDGGVYTARFGPTGVLLDTESLVAARTGGDCSGQCARMAIGGSAIGLLWSDAGKIRFGGLCK
jgi:hypothetical protein